MVHNDDLVITDSYVSLSDILHIAHNGVRRIHLNCNIAEVRYANKYLITFHIFL